MPHQVFLQLVVALYHGSLTHVQKCTQWRIWQFSRSLATALTMMNLAKFREIAKLPKHRGHSCRLGEFEDFGECGKFGKV